METREEYLLRLASVLDDIGADQQVIIRERYIEHAFGGKGAIAAAEPKSSPALMAARFADNRIKQQGVFTRSYPAGSRA
jgi:hypothetical protein